MRIYNYNNVSSQVGKNKNYLMRFKYNVDIWIIFKNIIRILRITNNFSIVKHSYI